MVEAKAEMINFKTKDGQIVPCEKKIAMKCELVVNALDGCDEEEDQEIDVTKVDRAALEKVIKYCTHIMNN